MSKILTETKNPTNLKYDSWYNEFYGDWLLNPPNPYFNPTLKECIQIEINNDKFIDTNQFVEDLKYDISGRHKEFILMNNSFQKNKELLIKYEQNQLSCELEVEEKELEFIRLTKKLIEKCFLTLDKGYLITNQLFILDKWFDEPPELSVFEIDVEDDEDDSF